MRDLYTTLSNPPHTDRKKIPVKQIVLATVAIAGVLTLSAIAPNAVQLLKKFDWTKRKYRKNHYLNSVVHRLISQNFLVLKNNSRGPKTLTLTEKGKTELRRHELRQFTLAKPKRWDGKYRLIIFDIREWKRSTRDELRKWLENFGFCKLQNSVWVYPYECKEAIVLLKAHFRIGREVLYLVVESIENDRWLKKEFGLT